MYLGLLLFHPFLACKIQTYSRLFTKELLSKVDSTVQQYLKIELQSSSFSLDKSKLLHFFFFFFFKYFIFFFFYFFPFFYLKFKFFFFFFFINFFLKFI